LKPIFQSVRSFARLWPVITVPNESHRISHPHPHPFPFPFPFQFHPTTPNFGIAWEWEWGWAESTQHCQVGSVGVGISAMTAVYGAC